jgi:hypothetical protein
LKITYSRASCDDLTRQFRYYLVALNHPELAIRFKVAVRETATLLKEWPRIAPVYGEQKHSRHEIRSWPIAGFKMIRLYFRLEGDEILVTRYL